MELSKKQVFWAWLMIGIMSIILITKAIIYIDWFNIVWQGVCLFLSVYAVVNKINKNVTIGHLRNHAYA